MALKSPYQPIPPEQDPDEKLAIIARREALTILNDHLDLCPLAQANAQPTPTRLHLTYWTLLAFMLGAGLLGGAIGTRLFNYLHP